MITLAYNTRKSNPALKKQFEKSCKLKNVEIIEVINDGTISLAKSYNQILDISNNDIVVLVHDDIELDRGWDVKLLDYFQYNEEYGILGVAGTTDLDESGVWWNIKHRMMGNVWHLHQGKWRPTPYSKTFKDTILPAVCIDGLFIAIHKNRIKSRFNEYFTGFHYYDIPICVDNFLLGVRIGVITDIGIKHKSIGVPNEQWQINRQKFLREYGAFLPLNFQPTINVVFPKIKLHREPKLAIIIPTKDNFIVLKKCIDSILKSAFNNYTIYITDTGSNDSTHDEYEKYWKEEILSGKIKISKYNFYHFAKINNLIVKNVVDKDTEVLLFCNDDIEIINDAISILIAQYLKHEKSVGTLGARLYYSDNSVQHGGIQGILTSKGQFALTHKGIKSYFNVDMDKQYDVLGNTGAFLMIGLDRFNEINGFDESTVECMEDVLLNFECILRGYKNIYMGEAVCYHFESITRSKNPKKIEGEREDLLYRVIPKIQKNINTLKRYMTIIK